jgi:hypothetical protein
MTKCKFIHQLLPKETIMNFKLLVCKGIPGGVYPLLILLPIVILTAHIMPFIPDNQSWRTAPQEAGESWTVIPFNDVQPTGYFHVAVIKGNILAVSRLGGLSGEGTTEDNSDNQPEARSTGMVYLFERRESDWSKPIKITAEGTQPGDHFGFSLAISSDTLVVGAPFKNVSPGGTAAGAVYIFQLQGGSWRQQARLVAPDGAPFDLFGNALAIQDDTLVVGARSADHSTAGRNAGAAYVYQREGSEWMLSVKLVADDAGKLDYFGQKVILYQDSILISAPGNDDRGRVRNTGAVYIFQPSGNSWRQVGKLSPTEIRPDVQFGQSMAINPITGTLVVSALQERQEFEVDYPIMMSHPPVMAYVFEPRGTGWRYQERLAPEPLMDFMWVVFARVKVEIGGDPQSGEVIASGMMGFFQQRGNEWIEIPAPEFIHPDFPPSGMMDYFGMPLTMSDDTMVFIGSPSHEDTNYFILLREIK